MPATTQPNANPTANRTTSSRSSISLSFTNESCSHSGMRLPLRPRQFPRLPAQAILRDATLAQSQVADDLLERRRQRRVKLQLQNDLTCQQRRPVRKWCHAPLVRESAVDTAVQCQPQGTFGAGAYKGGALADDATSRIQPP